MDTAERVQIASNFLLQAPPGEINDVLNDVRNIIADDEALQTGVQPALREHNLEQFTTVEVPGTSHQCVISEAARYFGGGDGQEERFMDPRSKITFVFDHLSLEASEPQPYEPDADTEQLRSALEAATQTYLKAHFYDGVASVFSEGGGVQEFIIQVVANKYSPANYWSGRWRSEFMINFDEGTVQGRILAHVHYYEQGNVQLTTTHDVSFNIPPGITTEDPLAASKILALIEGEEGRYQKSLNETYQEMSEKTFKSLRRALPMTRSKIDWDKILGYKLGAELSGSKEGYTTAS
ncbi:F-actin-capping protein subunit alpha [Leucoagaricus sp. SymC.cos]|nr:F-actin-capping protein subunit alpha [Leucoagaricus sp. SymC.cos]